MGIRKNPGPPLKSAFKGLADVIPPRWRARLGLKTLTQEQPTDIEPSKNGDRLHIASSVQQERTDERKKIDIRLGRDPKCEVMIEYVRTKDGQVGKRQVRYVPEGTAAPTFTELYQEFSQDASGNGWSEQITTTVENLFAGFDYKVERPDRVPPDFGAFLKVTEVSQTVAGTAALPTLGVGELMREEQQITEQTKRVTVRSRDLASLPMTIVNKDTSREKEIVTITRIWELDSTTPAVPTATIDVSFEKLGDGTAIETRKSTPVFPGPVYSKSIENLIPAKFRALIPTKVTEITSTGVADPNPTLGLGELSHEEQQLDEFNKRTKSVSFDGITPPVTFTDEETTEEFGGGVLDVVFTLNTSGSLTIDTGLRVVKSEVNDLGNGYEIRTTRQNQSSSWPELSGQDFDERLNVVLPFNQQVKDAGTGIGTASTDIKPIDEWRQQNKTVDLSAIAPILDAYILFYEGRVNIDLPDKLVSVEGILENAVGEGSNEEDGSFSFSGDYSVSQSLRASAQSSANIMPDVVITIKQFWGSNIKCFHMHFFLPSPVLGTALIDKVNALLSPNVITDWPKYNPEMVTLQALGQRVSLQVVASSQGSSSVSGSGSSSTAGGGTGFSREVGLTLKAIRISPTIHDTITVDGDTSDTESISATATAEAAGLGPAETITESASVTGSITPTSIPATDGDTDWPDSGYFLYRVDAQPYRYGYVQFHVIIVNAADFPINV